MASFSLALLIGTQSVQAAETRLASLSHKNTEMLEAISAATWREHAQEVMGAHYSQSVVEVPDQHFHSLHNKILNWVRSKLRPQWKHYAPEITASVFEESQKYGFDPAFLLAVIENESSFNPYVIGTSGEIGLMQVTPATAKWISRLYGLRWRGNQSLKTPSVNIQIGSAFLSYLQKEFNNQCHLYLAAYNMGSGNVKKNLRKNRIPKEYSSRVMKRYLRFYARLTSDRFQHEAPLEPFMTARSEGPEYLTCDEEKNTDRFEAIESSEQGPLVSQGESNQQKRSISSSKSQSQDQPEWPSLLSLFF